MEQAHEAQGTEAYQAVLVRNLRPADLPAVIALDARNTGRRRDGYFKLKLRENLEETGIRVSLAAELDGLFTGFLLARVYYGEFGALDPVAVLDTIDVHPDFRRRGVGAALLAQLHTNLAGLGVPRLRTEVGWDEPELLAFFQRSGFRLAGRLCLELPLAPRP